MARSRTSTSFLRILRSSPAPIYALDSQCRIVFANQACADWLGVDIESLTGVACNYDSAPRDDAVEFMANGLAPSPEVFDGKSMLGVISRRVGTEIEQVSARFTPVATDEFRGVIVIVTNEQIPTDDTAVHLHAEVERIRNQLGALYAADQLIATSPSMQRIRQQTELASISRVSTLVYGPSGSGREHIARTIYYARAKKLDCGPLSVISSQLQTAELLQLTLTSIVSECQENGLGDPTILMRDADKLPRAAQHELFSFFHLPNLQFDLLATSTTQLVSLTRSGEYHEGLANLMSIITLDLPPLSERREDIPKLAQSFLEDWNARGGDPKSGFTDNALDELSSFQWPGNIDQLRSVVEKACQASDQRVIPDSVLSEELRFANQADAHTAQPSDIDLDKFLGRIEAELIRRALRRSKNNKSKAAKILNISRPRLLRRIEQLGVE